MRRISLLLLLAAALPLFATDPNPSQRQRELIGKLLAQMNIDSMSKSMLDNMYAVMEKQFLDQAAAKGNDPDDVAEAKELFTSFREKTSKIDFGGLMEEAYVRIYAKYFNEQELADLVAFYDTPTGRKSISVMPDLMREGMQAGVEHVAPKIEETMAQVVTEHEKTRPWRRTISDIRSVGTALGAYAIDNDRFPAGDYASLKDALVPAYLAKLPEKDMWDHGYAYAVSPDGANYRIVSAGADTNFEWDSRTVVPAKEGQTVVTRYRERLEDDLIYADGEFVQLPVQAKPKGN
jgi:hypothetical protein